MKRALLLLALFGVALAGCTDGSLLVENQNPNATTDPSVSGLLSSSIQETSSDVIPSAAGATSYYVQHLASPSGSGVDQHFESRFGVTWSSVYNVLADTDVLIERAEAEDSPHYAGIARVIQAYNIGLATDLWGAIPYEQALQGRDGEITPAYDEQQTIYSELQSLLDTALQNLNAESSQFSPGDDDFVSLDQHAHTIHHCLQLRTISGNKTSGSQHPVTGDRSGIFILVGSVILSTVWCLGFQC